MKLLTPNTSIEMPELLELAIQNNLSVHSFPIHEYWIDIGQHETLERAKGEWQ